jgi:hypothetical protein
MLVYQAYVCSTKEQSSNIQLTVASTNSLFILMSMGKSTYINKYTPDALVSPQIGVVFWGIT